MDTINAILVVLLAATAYYAVQLFGQKNAQMPAEMMLINIAAPRLPIGSCCKFESNAGTMLSARIIGHNSRRGYALRRRGHPRSAVFYRYSVAA
jgi:hypothetical protein